MTALTVRDNDKESGMNSTLLVRITCFCKRKSHSISNKVTDQKKTTSHIFLNRNHITANLIQDKRVEIELIELPICREVRRIRSQRRVDKSNQLRGRALGLLQNSELR